MSVESVLKTVVSTSFKNQLKIITFLKCSSISQTLVHVSFIPIHQLLCFFDLPFSCSCVQLTHLVLPCVFKPCVLFSSLVCSHYVFSVFLCSLVFCTVLMNDYLHCCVCARLRKKLALQLLPPAQRCLSPPQMMSLSLPQYQKNSLSNPISAVFLQILSSSSNSTLLWEFASYLPNSSSAWKENLLAPPQASESWTPPRHSNPSALPWPGAPSASLGSISSWNALDFLISPALPWSVLCLQRGLPVFWLHFVTPSHWFHLDFFFHLGLQSHLFHPRLPSPHLLFAPALPRPSRPPLSPRRRTETVMGHLCLSSVSIWTEFLLHSFLCKLMCSLYPFFSCHDLPSCFTPVSN